MQGAYSTLSNSFIYDFSISGGKIGSQLTGMQIPAGSAIISFHVVITTTIAGSGAGNITFQTSNGLSMGAMPGTFPYFPGLIKILDSTSNKIMDTSLNILLVINAFTVISGRLYGVFTYYSPPL